jgi:hypothetical protein
VGFYGTKPDTDDPAGLLEQFILTPAVWRLTKRTWTAGDVNRISQARLIFLVGWVLLHISGGSLSGDRPPRAGSACLRPNVKSSDSQRYVTQKIAFDNLDDVRVLLSHLQQPPP